MKAIHRLVVIILIWTTAGPSGPALLAQPNPLELGSTLPIAGQEVFDIGQNQPVSITTLLGEKGTIFIFWSNQCAWTRRYVDRLEALAGSLVDRESVQVVLVNSNNKQVFPRESDEESRRWERAHTTFSYISDESAAIARVFGAERTPQVFAFDASNRLIYKGAIDDSPGDPSQVQDNYVEHVIRFLVGGKALSNQETRAFGCQIRY